MSKVLQSLPVGERVGIAFSGGLDTSVAVAWMRDKGAIPCTYTGDLGQPDEDDIDAIPGRALEYGAEISRLVDCKTALVEEGLGALACGAFHIRSGGKHLLQHDPARPRGDRHAARAGDEGRRRRHLGRRLHLQGQRHRAVLPLRPARQSRACASTSRGSTRTSSPSSAAAPRCRRGSLEHGFPYRDSAEKAYSTDANIWGATHEAKTLEHLDVSLETVEPIMGVRFWDPAVEIDDRGRHGHVRAGPPGRAQRRRVSPTRSSSCTRRTASADATASA